MASAKQTILTSLCLLLLSVTIQSVAQDKSADYGALRQLSSEELMSRGRSLYADRQPAMALACFTIVSERKDNSPVETQLRIRALNNCACVYKYFYFDYTRAYEYFIKAYDDCEQIGYEDFLPVIMVNMGDLLNDYSLNYHSPALEKQAHDIFEKCMEKALEHKNWELITTAFFNLSNQNYDLNLEKYRFLFSKEIPDSTPDIHFARLQYKGIEHMQRKEYEAARSCFQQQLQAINTPWAPERDSLAAFMSIATTYSMEGQQQQAVDYLQKALQLTADMEINDVAASICQQISECYQLLGNEQQSAYFHQQYLEKMEVMHSSQLAQIAEMNYIYQLKKEEKRSQVMHQRQFLQQMVLLASFIVLALILVFVVLLWQKNRQLKQRNRSLYEKNHQSMQLEASEQKLRKAYSKSSLNDEQRETLTDLIQEMLANPDVICQQDFTLNKLAKLINSNTTYVSQVINEKYGMAFSNLLGSHRIRLACQWMDDPERYGNITIEAIATGTGFKSRTAFVNAFKRETGLKPSEYLQESRIRRNVL